MELNFNNNLMDQKSAALYLGTTVGSLNTWRNSGKYKIPYVRWGHNIRYRKEDLDAWIAKHTNADNTCEHLLPPIPQSTRLSAEGDNQ